MKFFEGADVFPYTWLQIADIFWLRYPNPYSKHVRTEDVLYRKVENGVLHTKRLLTKTVRFTSFGYNISIKNEPIIEESFIDPRKQTIQTYTWNVGTSIAQIKEECFYRKKEENNTIIERKAWIQRTKLYLPSIIESYMIRRFQKNVQKTCKGLEYVLANRFPSSTHVETKSSSFLDKDKIREKAKKAKEMATPKTVPIIVA
ncbi:PRELI domain-containing protein 1, mitochondrial [Araneus ventricosus]|uniref:PRELI domain-containing protein 1, mitochondrial n=1 Tax=Araneus ventricosus TaxID=182803 RepID=A0A4Y2LL90_ARAVE|nr:PRELI domain-containing protein 1, mitochondrial [Araneus ventricosus]